MLATWPKKQCLHIGVDARFAIAEHSLTNPTLRTPRSEAGKSFGIGGALSSRLLYLDVMQSADKLKRHILVRRLSKKEAVEVFIRGA
jgi:hypothetical protein